MKLKVLLIEDSATYSKLALSMLQSSNVADFSVEHGEDLASGIEALKTGSIDAVLLDLTLPDSAGLETLTRIRPVAPASTPILVLSGSDDEQTTLTALHQGAADYLVKSEVSANWLARSIVYAVERVRPSEPETEDDATSEEGEAPEQFVEFRSDESDPSLLHARVVMRRLVDLVEMETLKERLLSRTSASEVARLHLDMQCVEYISNLAISVLLQLNKRLAKQDCPLTLTHVSDQVFDHFATRRFDSILSIERSQS